MSEGIHHRRDDSLFGNFKNYFAIAVVIIGWVVSLTTTTNKVNENKDKIDKQDVAVVQIKQSLTELTTTVSVLEERSVKQDRDMQEMKGYLREILHRVR